MVPRFFLRVVLLAKFMLTALSLPAPEHLEEGECRHQHLHLNSCDDDPSNTQKPGITSDLLGDIHLFAEYAAAAYLPMNYNSTGTPISCSGTCPGVESSSCPQVEKAGATTIEEFQDTPHFDDNGYIAIDDANRLVVLAFCGSKSMKNWFENLEQWRSPSDLCDECHIHHGFWEQWTSIRDMIIPNVEKATGNHPDYRFVVAGHSLGGALATIAAADIRKHSEWFLSKTELFSYGSPRVGDFLSARFLTEQSRKSFRITARDDVVPRLPWTSLGFMHTSPEFFIERNADDPRPEDITVLTGYFNSHGNSGQDAFDLKYHRNYFGAISGRCDDSPEPGDRPKS